MTAAVATLLSGGCASPQIREMEVTAYCGCGECCGWERGSWKYLKLDRWNRYVSDGARKGKPYYGKTAGGTKPRTTDPGIFSSKSITHPWTLPARIALFPWLLLPQKGTVAADTNYFPVGTRIKVPGYGWGVVEDRGGAIKGPERLDLYMSSHRKALEWGRKKTPVEVYPP